MKLANIRSSSEFIKEIDLIVTSRKTSFLEAVLLYCEMNNLEVETAAAIIRQNTVLKAKIQMDAENVNMMKKTARLPI
jgi:hypothetical protein